MNIATVTMASDHVSAIGAAAVQGVKLACCSSGKDARLWFTSQILLGLIKYSGGLLGLPRQTICCTVYRGVKGQAGIFWPVGLILMLAPLLRREDQIILAGRALEGSAGKPLFCRVAIAKELEQRKKRVGL